MWQNHGPAALAGARRLGVTAGLIPGVRAAVPAQALAGELTGEAAVPQAAGLGFYVENIATDYYAAYHRWQPDRPVTWLFDQAQARHQADPADASVFVRSPSLSSTADFAPVAARLEAHARALGATPLFYNLADEAGIADLTAAWDFDTGAASLAGFRGWLRLQYGSLAALNAEWGSAFTDWDAVQPVLTDAALRVADGNFAAWSDFKAWMDTAFANAVRAGTAAVHAAAPGARAGLEGAQAPGWGGYDYTRLAGATDVMEVTSDESAQRIALAMNPELITLQTFVLGSDPAELWRAALDGYRGTVLWDPDAALVRPDGSPGPQAAALTRVFAALNGAPGQAWRAAAPRIDPVAILYSPASQRVRWILDRQADAATGADWSRRRSETELEDNAVRAATRAAVDGLAHLAVQPRWLSPAMLEGGALAENAVKLLILPHTLALSDNEVAAIRRFAAAGGTVLADMAPGGYDGHGRRRAELPLGHAVTLAPGLPRDRLAAAIASAGIAPGPHLTLPGGAPANGATLRVRQADGVAVLGVMADAAAPDRTVVLTLPRPALVRDLLQPGPASRTGQLELQLGPGEPRLLEVRP